MASVWLQYGWNGLVPLWLAGCVTIADRPLAAGGGGSDTGLQVGGDAAGGVGGSEPTSSLVETVFGAACTEGTLCDDSLPCTVDQCDLSVGRCRFDSAHARCANTTHCDGEERCHALLGCKPGEPVGCDDGKPCTLDRCDEAARICVSVPRDLDGDGSVDSHCTGGDDCDDQNPSVSPASEELCGNSIDDNCSGEVDEASCVRAPYDDCSAPLTLTQAGTYAFSTLGGLWQYPTTCGFAPATSPFARDVVASVTVPPGGPWDVRLTARANTGVTLAAAAACGDSSAELACSGSFSPASGLGSMSKMRLYNQPSGALLYLTLTTQSPTPGTVRLEFLTAGAPATNETCGTAEPFVQNTQKTVEILAPSDDAGSACATTMGDLFYVIALEEPSDVRLSAQSLDGDGLPSLSLRDAACTLPADEVVCKTASAPELFRRSLGIGEHFVRVSATAPTSVALSLDVSQATPPPAGETCVAPAPLLSSPAAIDFYELEDNHSFCLSGASDFVTALSLDVPSDVLGVLTAGPLDTAALSLSLPDCEFTSQLGCNVSAQSPVRLSAWNVPAGELRWVAESFLGQPASVAYFSRPHSPPQDITESDACTDALEISELGGRWTGNTVGRAANYSAACDQGSVGPGGAADQIFKLVVTQPRRVVLDMKGSAYATLLNVREGLTCPGTSVPGGCRIGSVALPSFVDLSLPVGTYWVQVDGFALAEGPWSLDVYSSAL